MNCYECGKKIYEGDNIVVAYSGVQKKQIIVLCPKHASEVRDDKYPEFNLEDEDFIETDKK